MVLYNAPTGTLGPVVLGIILGRPLEEKLIQGLVASGGSPLGFFSRPVAAALGIATIVLWISPLVARIRRKGERDLA